MLYRPCNIGSGFLSCCEALYKYWKIRNQAYPWEWYQVCNHRQLVLSAVKSPWPSTSMWSLKHLRSEALKLLETSVMGCEGWNSYPDRGERGQESKFITELLLWNDGKATLTTNQFSLNKKAWKKLYFNTCCHKCLKKNLAKPLHLFSCLKLFGKGKESKEDPETPIFFTYKCINFSKFLKNTFQSI